MIFVGVCGGLVGVSKKVKMGESEECVAWFWVLWGCGGGAHR